ncbi:MAG: alpha/beta fold hydrolase [Rhodocyclaceae bacterium]|nr:alpha/beta fold hydrolase [Rhodocyclaceae bacterium]
MFSLQGMAVVSMFLASLLLVGFLVFARMSPEKMSVWALNADRRRAGVQLKSLRIRGFNIPYLEAGSGEPLVLIHGFGADKDHFTRIARHLKANYRVLSIDLPGFGEATRDIGVLYGINDQVTRLHAILVQLDIKQVHLGGSSMGGYIVAQFAATYPEMVSSVWLLNAAGTFAAHQSEMMKTYVAKGKIPLLVEHEDDYQKLVGLVMSKPPYFPQAVLTVLARRAVSDLQLHRQILHQFVGDPQYLEQCFVNLETPALIVWGSEDKVLHPLGADTLHRLFINSEVKIMDGIGHLPMLEDPEQTAADYIAFRAKLDTMPRRTAAPVKREVLTGQSAPAAIAAATALGARIPAGEKRATPNINQQWCLKKRPVGLIANGDFELREVAILPLAEGQVKVRNVFLSLDPAMRGWLIDRPSYVPPVQIGELMRGLCVGVVIESKNEYFVPGDFVQGMFGWQTHFISNADGEGMTKLPPSPLPLEANLGLFGLAGMTAYFGLIDVGQPKEGETLLVSGAAGSVGSLVGQIGKIKGLRVVGIAGSDDKCAWLVNELGFDAAVNYKSADLRGQLKAACPTGVDVYFENVGGEILDTALSVMNNFGRVVVCGLISQYNATDKVPGPYNFASVISKRLRIQGFVAPDYSKRVKEMLGEFSHWYSVGKLKYRVDIVQGLDAAPLAINKLFSGDNNGKLIVQISPVR